MNNLSEEEKKAIEGLKKDLLIHECWEANNLDKIFKISHLHSLRVVLNLIEKQQAEIEKKDKIIYEIAKAFKQDDIRSIEEIIKYFTNKVERN